MASNEHLNGGVNPGLFLSSQNSVVLRTIFQYLLKGKKDIQRARSFASEQRCFFESVAKERHPRAAIRRPSSEEISVFFVLTKLGVHSGHRCPFFSTYLRKRKTSNGRVLARQSSDAASIASPKKASPKQR